MGYYIILYNILLLFGGLFISGGLRPLPKWPIASAGTDSPKNPPSPILTVTTSPHRANLYHPDHTFLLVQITQRVALISVRTLSSCPLPALYFSRVSSQQWSLENRCSQEDWSLTVPPLLVTLGFLYFFLFFVFKMVLDLSFLMKFLCFFVFILALCYLCLKK